MSTAPKMVPEIKERWVAALRSGDYRQTKGALRDSDGFCCLGVLCEITKEETGLEWTVDGWFDGSRIGLGGRISETVGIREATIPLETIPPTQRHLAGDPRTVKRDYWLSDLNDRGFTFDQIADLIEASDL